MKKSKVIVPALGLLLLSTAASVTGTVAWFTANKSISATAGQFAVASTTGDLELTATAGVGTTPASNNRDIDVNADVVLADASVNHNTSSKEVFYPQNNATKVVAHTTKFDAATSATVEYKRQTVNGVAKYSAFTWKYTFKFTPEDDNVEVGLYLDFEHSNVEDKEKSNENATRKGTDTKSESFKGFRLLFYCAEKQTVWAHNRDKGDCTYIASAGDLTGDSAITPSSYADANILAADNKGSVPADGVDTKTNALAKPNYLGTLGNKDATTGKVSLELTCVAWYEGTDADIVNNSTGVYDKVLATMKFEARNLKAA